MLAPRASALRPRALGATLGAYPISYSAAAAAALNTAAEGGPDSTRGASSEREQAAVKLLKDQGVEELDALDILSDPQINIADELICDVIKRITPDKPPANPGGWWRIALRRHQRYGPDPVVAKVEADKARQPERSLDYYDAQGRQLVERMSEGEVMEAHVILIEHYRRQGNTTAANTLEAVDDARSSPEFWRAVGKNQKVIGCELQLDGRES